jgi:hypothetical protein
VSWCAIGFVFVAEVLFTVVFCMAPWWAAVLGTVLYLSPALVMVFTRNPYRAFGACLGIAPFLIWAGYVSCISYTGSGVPHVGASAFLFGIPVAVVAGLVFGTVVQPAEQAGNAP